MGSVYKYWAFGLTIASEINFPELLEDDFDGAQDVTISWGKTAVRLTGPDVVYAEGLAMSASHYLLKIQDVAFYEVSHGSHVIIEPQPGTDLKTIRLYLLSNVMAAVLHQRDAIPLHASAVRHQDGIVLFCGDSGAGKSTTVTAMQQKGYKIFSDDLCILRAASFSNYTTQVWPSYPVVKLWENSYQVNNMPLPAQEYQLRDEIPKYAKFYHQEFCREPRPIRHIFILEAKGGLSNPQEECLNASQAFAALVNMTYRPAQISGMNKRQLNFSLISQLSARVPVSRLSRPEHNNSIHHLTRIVEQRLHAFN
jgi:hypothetical protein